MANQSQTQGNGTRKDKGKFGNIDFLVALSRAFAASLDPLFFFIPVIHEDKKCISEDKKMWINAVFWRSFLDFIYLVYFVKKFHNVKKEDGVESKCQWYKFRNFSQEEKLWMWLMFDILVILPIPQVLISIILPKMRHAKYTDSVTILNAVLLIQYVPRVLQIYRSLKELDKVDISVGIKASFYFFLYLLAAHVAGAFWYFYSTQRLTSCWRKAVKRVFIMVDAAKVYMQGGAEKSPQRRASESIRALESIENSPTELVPLYKQRSASKSIEISENERELELDDAVVEKLLKELGQLYKQRSASKSIKKSEKW